jgi:hypothetical protein
MPKPNGFILWEGISRIDGKTPVVCIVNGLNSKGSQNEKTGAMLQTFILLQNEHPMEAVNNGNDSAICGGCIHRKEPTGHRSCYVNIIMGGPRAVWAAYKAGSYDRLSATELATLANGRTVRVGSYGDPAAIPLDIWTALLSGAAGRTGYTHQWRSSKFAGLSSYVQASCDKPSDVAKAHAKGWKTFLVMPVGSALPSTAIHCPASKENGKKTTCEDCLLCDGTKADVVIHSHGAGKLNLGRNLTRKTRAPLPMVTA